MGVQFSSCADIFEGVNFHKKTSLKTLLTLIAYRFFASKQIFQRIKKKKYGIYIL